MKRGHHTFVADPPAERYTPPIVWERTTEQKLAQVILHVAQLEARITHLENMR